jgi:hypothetical protein
MMIFFTCTEIALAVLRTFLQHGFDNTLARGGGQAQVDETRAGDFCRFDQIAIGRIVKQGGDQRLRDFARILFERLGDLHRQVAGDVAVRRIARAFQRDVQD